MLRPPIIGTAVVYHVEPTASTRVGLLIAFYCMQFYLAEGNMIFSLISRNIAGQTKKSTALAMTFIAWAAGNMTAPQVCVLYLGAKPPRFAFPFVETEHVFSPPDLPKW